MKQSLCLILIPLIFWTSCKKDSFITSPDAQVRITADTLHYDTVFTSTGSITQSFKIVNENDQKLKLSSVKLMGGNASAYKINVDGIASSEVNNIELAANDSLYVFVQVNINPSSANLPFVIRDSIQVSYNGTDKQVQLEAWGQNAHFFRNKIITADETWTNDLPYVILGSLTVNPGKILTIDTGCRIYVHADAPIVVNGTLDINGDKDTANRVYFRGDRLDDPYKDYPAAWPGIIFGSNSMNNVFNYAVIKNAYQAIALQDPSVNANPKLTLNACIIDNAYDAGILALNSSITARNCLISNCGKNIQLAEGGNYQFTHCTVASFSNSFITHKEPVLFLSNYIVQNSNPVTADLDALFRNCIFWGENGLVNDEVVVSKSGSSAFNVNFDYNIWKVQNAPTNVTATQVINNQSPLFDSINTVNNYYNFRLKDNSPAIDKGVNTGIISDLDGNPRPVGLPDLGSYEHQ